MAILTANEKNEPCLFGFRLVDLILVGNFAMNTYQAVSGEKSKDTLKSIDESLNNIEGSKVLDRLCDNLEKNISEKEEKENEKY